MRPVYLKVVKRETAVPDVEDGKSGVVRIRISRDMAMKGEEDAFHEGT